MRDEIVEIRQDIFECKMRNITERTIELISNTHVEMGSLIDAHTKRQQFNEIINMITISIENKDYLLLADILMYELRTFISLIKT